MTLGSDVSEPDHNRQHSAAREGLSIVVPVYNEAAGSLLLHQRLMRSRQDR